MGSVLISTFGYVSKMSIMDDCELFLKINALYDFLQVYGTPITFKDNENLPLFPLLSNLQRAVILNYTPRGSWPHSAGSWMEKSAILGRGKW